MKAKCSAIFVLKLATPNTGRFLLRFPSDPFEDHQTFEKLPRTLRKSWAPETGRKGATGEGAADESPS
jgi:hypothetical protein